MKPAILIFALSRSAWIGGVYYRKNIINLMIHSKKIMEKYKIVLLVNRKYQEIFNCFSEEIDIVTCPDQADIIQAGLSIALCCIRNKIKFVFPVKPYFFFKVMGITPISWIADFQHCYYPQFFEEAEIEKRNRDYKKISKAHNPLVLSSNTAWLDLKKFYCKERKQVYVVHFTSAINDEIRKLNEIDAEKILRRYHLVSNQYFLVSNQFWQHKNHIVVLRALKVIKEIDQNCDVKVAFTGELSDRRDPEYINKIQALMNEEAIRDNVILLGFINRAEQLCLMKYAKAVIQPSLFEGWGTVVEDAKVLNKKIILSDISVHREQKNDNCILFEKDNPKDLADKMIECEKYSINKTEDYTFQYSKELEKIFQ